MRLTLIDRKQESANVESFIFKPDEAVAYTAGQFLHYVLHHEPTDERGSDRWFTASSAPSEGHIMITTRFTDENGSSFKKALAGLKAGSIIEISDVDGDFTVTDPSAPMVFIAGGIGVTPFRSILKEAAHAGTKLKATLLYSNRDDDFAFKSEFDALAKENPDLKIVYLPGQRIDEPTIRTHVPDVTTPIFYVSGPEPMVEAFMPMLKGMGVPAEHLKGDWFPGYPID